MILKTDQFGEMPRETIESQILSAFILNELTHKTDSQCDTVSEEITVIAKQVLCDCVVNNYDLLESISEVITAIDGMVSKQLSQIMQHPAFQALASSWHGLHYLVLNTKGDATLKIRFMNISKQEFGEGLQRYRGNCWRQSPLYGRIHDDAYNNPDGEPFGCLIGDYTFSHTPTDVALLQKMSRILAESHTPFIASASPDVLQIKSWGELSSRCDVRKVFNTPEYVQWRLLRDSEDARYIGLALPRFRSRLRYGAKAPHAVEFQSQEVNCNPDSGNRPWINAAYGMAVNITRSFMLTSGCARISGVETGGRLEAVPLPHVEIDSAFSKSIGYHVEVILSDLQEAQLVQCGFMPLAYNRAGDCAAFLNAHSLQKPSEYDDIDSTVNAEHAARLPYLFACCRFVQYLKCIVRDNRTKFKSGDDMQMYLQRWILNYVQEGDRVTARRPLAEAQVEVEKVKDSQNDYICKAYLLPRYQLEGLTTTLRFFLKLSLSQHA